jgi:crotonobetainyl-CoA:carnitine CoA-transferase CaiB-like acyl-CoA transferase
MSTDITPPKGALDGVRVLDFTAVMAGPYCTRLLADVGADVIKVEGPEGDMIRPPAGPFAGWRSAYFGQLNAGKRSLVLNLKRPEALEVARALARRSDVVVENFRPGVMRRLGVDYETLSAENPGLIYCSISGYGQSGPAADKPAYAPIIHAASGFDMAHLGYQDEADRPARTGIFMADVLGGLNAFGAIQTALFHRERTGAGQRIDVSLVEGMLSMMVYECSVASFSAEDPRHTYSPLRAADGYVIIAPVSQKNFEALTRVIDRPGLMADPRFSTIRARTGNWSAVMDIVGAWTRSRAAEVCERLFTEAGVPCSRYRTVGEALRDEQLAYRGSLGRIVDRGEEYSVPNPAFKFSASRAGVGPRVAELGQHSDEVLTEILGLSADQIAVLRAENALG